MEWKTVIKDPLVKNRATTTTQKKDPFCKRIIIIDDEPDITLTFKATLEDSNNNTNNSNIKFEVYTYNDPLAALLEFKSDFYDLLLIDINMPYMDGFELCKKILELDVNVRVCFMTAGEINTDAAKEVHPLKGIGCFIKKPISAEQWIINPLKESLNTHKI